MNNNILVDNILNQETYIKTEEEILLTNLINNYLILNENDLYLEKIENDFPNFDTSLLYKKLLDKYDFKVHLKMYYTQYIIIM